MAKLLTKKTSVGGGGGGEGWGMGFFLVFFPQEHTNKQDLPLIRPTTTIKCSKYSSSTPHLLISKAQSTISICALLFFFTLLLLLFTLEPPNNNNISHRHTPRPYFHYSKPNSFVSDSSSALQRLGTLYSRGTNPMNDLLLCHVSDSTTSPQLRTFLRAFHRSGLLSKSDLLFIFPSPTTPDSLDGVIREENDLFFKLIRRHQSEFGNNRDSPASFDVTQFVKSGKKESGKPDPIWGGKKKSSSFNSNSNSSSNAGGIGIGIGIGTGTESGRLGHGSIVGFGVGELDPEDSLSGFLDHVPLSLRRWASYPMILRRLRRNFKHVMLVDVKEVLLLGDPLVRVRNRSPPESVFLSPTKHNRKTTTTTDHKTVNPAVIMGGARGVRRLSAAMLTEIVRASTHNKRKGPVTESALLSRLAANEFVQKSIRVVVSGESIPEASSLGGVEIANQTMVRRGNSNNILDIEVLKHICSFPIEASIYSRECGRKVQPF